MLFMIIYFFKETLSPEQIREIRIKHKFLTLNDKGIETWHRKFMEA